MAIKKKHNNGKTSERHFGVILEHLDDKISTVAEQFGDVQKKLDMHTEMIGKLATDVEEIKEVLDEHTKILDEHTKILDEHTKILDEHTKTLERHGNTLEKVSADVEVIKEDIEFVKGGMKRKVDIEEFVALERRVAMLEKHRQ